MKTHEEGRSGALALDVWLASETPRSNAACAAWESGLGDGPSVSLLFAQRLERENAKLREALSAYLNADDWTKEQMPAEGQTEANEDGADQVRLRGSKIVENKSLQTKRARFW